MQNIANRFLAVAVIFTATTASTLAAQPKVEIDPAISVQERLAAGNSQQKYFLIEHQPGKTNAPAKRGLLLILPGGPGGADFLPFCANILTLYGVPKDFIVAELVAPQWTKDEDRIVWPGKLFPDQRAKFTSEEFLSNVIADVQKSNVVDARYIFTLGWSSSGHVLYSASLSNTNVTGSLICMSRFIPAKMPSLDQAKGKNYFFYHSPDDPICPFAEAELAARTLKEHGARTKLVSYPGGHGWQPNTYYCDRIMDGIKWLKECNTTKTNAP